jgi:hypothetical protein
VQPNLCSVWHTKRLVRCARLNSGEQATLGRIWRRTAIIHRTVRWYTRLSGEPTAASATVGRAWPAPTVGRGHRTVRCAPDSVWCANCQDSATVVCARIGRRSRTGHEQWLSGGAPDCPVHHPTEGKDSLPCWPPTLLRAFFVINLVRARGSNSCRFLTNGKIYKEEYRGIQVDHWIT